MVVDDVVIVEVERLRGRAAEKNHAEEMKDWPRRHGLSTRGLAVNPRPGTVEQLANDCLARWHAPRTRSTRAQDVSASGPMHSSSQSGLWFIPET